MPNLPCTSHFTVFPWDLPYISLSVLSAGVDLSDWSQEGKSWMNEEQNCAYTKWGHKTLKAPEKSSFVLAGSLRAKPSACVCCFYLNDSGATSHGMSWGSWVYPAKPLLPQGFWALWSLCVPVVYTLSCTASPSSLSLPCQPLSPSSRCLFSLILHYAA